MGADKIFVILLDFQNTEDGEERILVYKPCSFGERNQKYNIAVLSSFEINKGIIMSFASLLVKNMFEITLKEN